MSVRLLGLAPKLRPEELAPVRPKTLKRRLHCDPDPDLEGLSSEQAALFKIRATQVALRFVAELRSLRGGQLSNYALAEAWLGSRTHEPTVRGWLKLSDTDRYPRTDDLKKLEKLVNDARDELYGGARK